MARDTIRLVLAIPVFWLCGCGTVISTQEPHSKIPGPYSGVKVDAKMSASTYPSLVSLCCVADLPASFVADTLLLPFTIGKNKDSGTVNGQPGANQASQPGTPPSPAPRPTTPETTTGWVGLPRSMATQPGVLEAP
jgi:uncharacterized protein YceK